MSWSVADIDTAILRARAEREAAIKRGDLDNAGRHQAWIDRLLDARPCHDDPPRPPATVPP